MRIIYSTSICLNLFRFRVSACFAYDKTVINQHRVEKSAFEDKSGKFSVNIKINDLLGILCKVSFTPAVTSCYQVHGQNADPHIPSAVARVSEAPPEILRGAPHTLLAYYYELQ